MPVAPPARHAAAGLAVLLAAAASAALAQPRYSEPPVLVVIDPLPHATTQVVADAAFQADRDKLGMDPVPDATPERTLQLLKDETARWTSGVQAAGMAPGHSQR